MKNARLRSDLTALGLKKAQKNTPHKNLALLGLILVRRG